MKWPGIGRCSTGVEHLVRDPKLSRYKGRFRMYRASETGIPAFVALLGTVYI